MRPKGEKPKERLFTFRSAGWVILLAFVVGGVVILRTVEIVKQHRLVAFGDCRNVSTYKFDLEPCLIPRNEIIAAGMPREGVRPMVDPDFLTVQDILNSPDRKIRKLLVSGDRVIGVEVGDEARAYPLRMMNWHEVVNDTLDGVPIAVTYHPLTEGIAVFDRRIDGKTRVFAMSGLLWRSSQLLYARNPEGTEAGGESLWSQLLAKAVTGPAAKDGARLPLLPFIATTWGEWVARHPDASIVAPDRVLRRQYPRMPYSSYRGTRLPRFPVGDYPPPGTEGDAWSPILVVDRDGEEEIVRGAEVTTTLPAVRQAFWWSWHAVNSPVR